MKFFSSERIVLIFIGILFLFPLIHKGMFVSHDGFTHMVRAGSYYESIVSGIFPVRWAFNLNYGYGNPLFIFIYPFPYILSSVFHLLGFSIENSIKLILGISFVASSLFFYEWIKQLVSKKTAFLASIIYLLTPVHFLNFYVRSGIGDMLGYAIIPLCLMYLERNLKKPTIYNFIFGSITYSLLILSHNGLAIIFSFVFLLYVLIKSKTKSILFKNLLIFIFGLMISSFFWFPALLERKYLAVLEVFNTTYIENFPSLLKIIYSEWGYGVNVNSQGGLSPQIGIFAFVFAAIGIYFVYKNIKRKEIIFWLLMVAVSIFVSTKYALVLYQNFSVLRDFQYPWRFLILASFSSTVIAAYVLEILPKNIRIILLLAVIIYSLPFIKVSGYISNNDSVYKNYGGLGYDHGEALVRWIAGDFSSPAKQNLEIIGGRAKVTNFSKGKITHSFTINSETKTTILDNTVFFPGWKAEIDGVKTEIQFQDMNHRGLIAFDIPEGKHSVRVVFVESLVRYMANMVSLISLIFTFVILIFGKRIGIIKRLYEKK